MRTPKPFALHRAKSLVFFHAGIMLILLLAVSCGDDDSVNPVQEPLTVTDIDGNIYQTVTIGDQVWMAENLRVTHYRDGTPIPNITNAVTWGNLVTGAYCNYNNDTTSVVVYGRLYNWYAVIDAANLAPEGWHVPTEDEWKQLEIFLGMSDSTADLTDFRGDSEGCMLKDTSALGTDDYGFSAMCGGYRSGAGAYDLKSLAVYFWSDTEQESIYVWYRHLHKNSDLIKRWYSYKHNGFSVRCVKD